MQVLLAAAIVAFGCFTSVHPNDRVRRAVSDEGSLKEYYRGYFDSMMKNKAADQQTYRDKLMKESVKEQEDFDAMKGEMQYAHEKNLKNRNGNSKQDGSLNKAAIAKRALLSDKLERTTLTFWNKALRTLASDEPLTNMDTDALSMYFSSSTPLSTTIVDGPCTQGSIHDQFVCTYGNNPNTSGIWPYIREIQNNRTALKRQCQKAWNVRWPYRFVFWGDLIVRQYPLTFPKTNYQTITADLLICEFDEGFLVVTKGMRDDCMTMVYKVDVMGPRIFHLRHHLCGCHDIHPLDKFREPKL